MELAADHGVEMPIAVEVDAVVNEGHGTRRGLPRPVRTTPESELHGVA